MEIVRERETSEWFMFNELDEDDIGKTFEDRQGDVFMFCNDIAANEGEGGTGIIWLATGQWDDEHPWGGDAEVRKVNARAVIE